MAATDITIVNAALVSAGLERINSFNDGNKRAEVASASYEKLVLDELGKYRWNWAAKSEALSKIAETPPDPWLYSYQLPADLLDLRTVKQYGEGVDYALTGSKVLTDADNGSAAVVAHFGYRPEEAVWPGWWSGPFIIRLEGVFLRSFGERHAEAEKRDERADKGFLTARRIDAQSQSPRNPYRYPILDARRG